MNKKEKLLIEQQKTFFKTSNLIECIYDKEEDKAQYELFMKLNGKAINLSLVKEINANTGHQNDYAKPGVLRDYPVRVGGNICMGHSLVEDALIELLKHQPDSMGEMLKWHIEFESIHPFGDGNGRTGRMLLAMQAYKDGLELPFWFFCKDNFYIDSYRQRYYQLFKK